MVIATLIAAVFSIAIGFGLFLVNRSRLANQVFLGFSLLLSLWLFAVYAAMRTAVYGIQEHGIDPLVWYRINATLAAFVPWAIRLLGDAVTVREGEMGRIFRNSINWLILGVLLSGLCFSELFITDAVKPGRYDRGFFYYVYSVFLFAAFLTLVFQLQRQTHQNHGIRRVELQFLSLNTAIIGVFVVAVNTLGAILSIRGLPRVSPIMILGFQIVTAWAIGYYRVYDIVQVFQLVLHRFVIMLVLGLGIVIQWGFLRHFMTPTIAFSLCIIIWGPIAMWLDSTLREILDLDGVAAIHSLRESITGVARSETNVAKLLLRYREILCRHFEAKSAEIMLEHSPEALFRESKVAFEGLREAAWATPESLDRRRASPALSSLRDCFRERELGVVVAAPYGAPGGSLVIALGQKTSGWPYTYPEVRTLLCAAELIDNILTHARLSAESALKQKLEDLMVLSRGLAHDLKNLVVPISSFLVYTETRLINDVAASDVHAAAKRSVNMMTGYIGDALLFAKRLEPNYERVLLTAVLRAVLSAAVHDASDKAIKIRVEAEDDIYIEGDAVLIQRLFMNLVGNAIDACLGGESIAIVVSRGRSDWVRVAVSDTGPGILAEDLDRVFEPYFTTKQFGGDKRGFGLGLSICKKIVELHRGGIWIDSIIGQGTTVTIDLQVRLERTSGN